MVLDKACGGLTPPSVRALHGQVRGYDPTTGLQEWVPPGLVQSPLAMKGKASRDPDLPTLKESLTGPHAEEFWKAMEAEIAGLESQKTWKIVERSEMPEGMKAVPRYLGPTYQEAPKRPSQQVQESLVLSRRSPRVRWSRL